MRRALTVVAILGLMAAVAQCQQKKRVAVMNFDYATVQSNVAAIFGANQDIGRGIADLLVDKLVNDGTYSVIERKAIDKIMAEQNFSNSDRVDPSSAAKIGRILGVDAIVIGSITQFGRDDKKTSVGGAGLGLVVGGTTPGQYVDLATSEIYHPATGLFSAGPAMTAPRRQFTATALADGRVLLAGAYSGTGSASAELFDLLPEDERRAILPEARAAEAIGVTGFTLPTLYRWVTSDAGRAASLYPFMKGHYLGSGPGDMVLAEAGLDGESQAAAILRYCETRAAAR